jgi:murein DD-endopeptidase MepM/ murein hydrolase activator NlpD
MPAVPAKKLREEMGLTEEQSQPRPSSARLQEEIAKRRYKQQVLEEYRLPKIEEERRRRERAEQREKQAGTRRAIRAIPTGSSSGSSGSAPIALGLAGIGALLLVSGIQGKSLAEVLRGEFGSKTNPSAKPESGLEAPEVTPSGESGGVPPGFKGGPGGTVSPFPKGSKISWGRSDKGVDGTVTPGTPLRAMKNGVVEIGHDPGGFGASYPILHTDSGQIFYYGHAEPMVASGTRVQQGQYIGRAHLAGSWGNSTTPGGFEIGEISGGEYGSPPGAAIRNWLMGLVQI